ncbi:hypothetical protein AB0C13_40095, partial [Streptomyces sp. NPDC049099]|uniref:hypothetical protein n=1 Tax=Streptomyces sp. NPDC049099 TaxID=3155768 RepID=UPI003412A560
AFDFATVPEKKADQASPGCDLASYPADSDKQHNEATPLETILAAYLRGTALTRSGPAQRG